MSVQIQTGDRSIGQTVILLLQGVLAVVRELSVCDDPIDLEEVFQIVADGQRVDPGTIALVRAKATLDEMAIHHLAAPGPIEEGVIEAYLAGDVPVLYDRLRYHRGVDGIVACLERAIEMQTVMLWQPPLPLLGGG